MNLSLLSPRRKLDATKQSLSVHSPIHGRKSARPPPVMQPPPLQRPSRMVGTLPGSSRGSVIGGLDGWSRPTTPNAVFPPRPFTSEHVPCRLANAVRSPRR